MNVALRRGSGRMALAGLLCWTALGGASCAGRSGLAHAISDREFWRLIETLSEPPGKFTISDNLVSNEPHVAENARHLSGTGGVYIGVGPEQNFTYVARLRPAIAFIVDIRRENRNLHLFYKALFELSADRADFVARLFSRARPAGLGRASTVEEIFAGFDHVPPSPEQLAWNSRLIRERLLTTHGLPLETADLEWIDRVFKAFYDDGPGIQFWRSAEIDAVQPSYRRLMTLKDGIGQYRSFLATEDSFAFVRQLQANNLIVPVVGDFAGPAALRRIGSYAEEHGEIVRAFYGSNVGVYLTNAQTRVYCRNLESLPRAIDTWFIERDGVRTLASKLKSCAPAP